MRRVPTAARRASRLAVAAISIAALVPAARLLAADAPAPASKPAATAPARPRVYTYRDYQRDALEFNRRTLVEAYKSVGKHDPKWDAQASAYLEQIAQRFTLGSLPSFYRPDAIEGESAKLLAAGEALIDAGCDDPIVMYCHATLLNDSGKRTEAMTLLLKAIPDLQERKYPAYRIAVAAHRLGQLLEAPAEAGDDVEQHWVLAFCGEHSDFERRQVVEACWDSLATRAQQKAFVAALAERTDADPWMKNVITGRLHIRLAWDSRNGDRAGKVTAEGPKEFYTNLTKARDALTAAWKAAPQLPEPASDMITVALGGGDTLKEKPLDWFERALAAQVDFDEAYGRMVNGPLLPRWGGSYEEMLQLAQACIAQPRFDTSVPFYYLRIIRQIGDDSGKPWALLKEPAVYEDLVRVVDGYAAAKESKRAHYKSMLVAAAWRAGRMDEAKKALEDLTAAGLKPEAAAFRFFDIENSSDVVGNIYALAGPHAKAIAAAEKQNEEGDAKAALAALQAVIAEFPADAPEKAYLAGRARAFDAAVKFAAGEWSPLQTSGSLSEWQAVTGRWRVSSDGVITGQVDSANPISPWAMLYWLGHKSGRDPGGWFELAGTIDFRHNDLVSGNENGGLIILPSGGNDQEQMVGIDIRRAQMAGFMIKSGMKRVDVGETAEFRVLFEDRTVTLFVNGKQVGEPHDLPKNWEGNLLFGLSMYGDEPTQFKNLRIRKINPEAAK